MGPPGIMRAIRRTWNRAGWPPRRHGRKAFHLKVRVYQSYGAVDAVDRYQDFTQEVGLLNGTLEA